MWLLNSTSQTLEFFPDDRTVKYAIVSHCWTDYEVSFAELRSGNPRDDSLLWRKVQLACRQARQDQLNYVWLDTCCIDKTSSAELSEAINSMYRWYQNAAICYVYMEDVLDDSEFPASRWFSRGWTLQELIAPNDLVFYNSQWDALGSRFKFANDIGKVTGIPLNILGGHSIPEQYCVAQRMSWAAARQTTRAEDMAYSLMGLFNVNLPMLYGEGGDRAFVRLQEEIVKSSNDQTIFGWSLKENTAYRSLLANSPAEFAECGSMNQIHGFEDLAFQQTNVGLQVSFQANEAALGVYHVELLAAEHGKPIGIFLGCPNVSGTTNRFGRRMYQGTDRKPIHRFVRKVSQQKQFNVPKNPFLGVKPEEGRFGFFLQKFLITGPDNFELQLYNGVHILARPSTWFPETSTIELSPEMLGPTVAFGLPGQSNHGYIFLKLGLTAENAPWAWIFPTIRGNSSSANTSSLVLHDLVRDACERQRWARGSIPASDSFHDVSGDSLSRVDKKTFSGVLGSDEIKVGSFIQGDRVHGLMVKDPKLRVWVYRSKGHIMPWTVAVEYKENSEHTLPMANLTTFGAPANFTGF